MSLLLRNMFFTILQPGLVAGVFPYLLAKDSFKTVFQSPVYVLTVAGLLISALGVFITCHCVFIFATDGQGTLSPADPTQRLVISGLYKYSRNPMYVGVIMMLVGEWVFTQQEALGYYTLLIFTAFNIFIVYWEEPRLAKDFGHDYNTYRQQVRRWV